ncbi:MAG: hypothetical protein HY922_02325 [Elusimicrobia bacterium]|nr:hypothetical protein [Elusimicrobiota bacterium]
MADVSIEYPSEGEVVHYHAYTFQVKVVEGALHVRISVDGGPWHPCRESMGLWWYDWCGYASGEHKAMARIEKRGEIVIHSDLRRFKVELEP